MKRRGGKTRDLFPDELKRMRLQLRILRNVVADAVTGCWRWTGATTPARGGAGYPRMTERLPGRKNPVPLLATRVSLEVFKGPPPTFSHEAAHDPVLCPYTDCVNPEHLRWATRSENEQDKRHPGRLKRLREVHPPVGDRLLFGIELEEPIPF